MRQLEQCARASDGAAVIHPELGIRETILQYSRRADLGRLGSVLNRGEAGGEEQRGGMGRAALLHDTLSFTKTWKTQKHKKMLLESTDISA